MPAVASSGGGVSVKDRINELVDRYHDGVAPIVALGQMVLRRQAVRFDGQVDDSVLLAFTELLRRTNKVAPGVGLAAPQVGVPVQIAVMEDPAPVPAEIAEARQRYPLEYFAAINPEYRPVGSKRRGFFEGCLSMPGWAGVVNRPLSVQATYLDVAGQVRRRAFDGWQARIVQHEFDHLRGVVYVDKVEPRSLSTIEAYLANWSQPVPTKAARELGFRLD
ncbi:peptide deformylase [Kribbella sandramycini]|nr:peptide deformylase [Kribbella sandramycini]